MTTHQVVVAGGGPTGMMLAGELALAGVDVAVVERRTTPALAGSRAGGLSARTLEVFDQRGVVDRFLSEGQTFQVAGFAATRLDISDFPTRHHYGLALWQNHIERIMADWIGERAVTWHRGLDVTGCVQDDSGVTVALSDGSSLRSQYLVGCDGGRSIVRKTAGIAFPGWDPTTSAILAQVEMRDEPPLGIHRTAMGMHSFGKVEYTIAGAEVVYQPGGTISVMLPDAQVESADPTFDDLRAALIRVCGTDYGVHRPTWISRFTDMARQAAKYRDRRVLLAGDAAHVHSPVGGQGLNTGVQDAMNLGWKLAQVVHGASPDSLLDTYHVERHPVGARVLQSTMAQTALLRVDDRIDALREVVSDMLRMDEPRKRYGAMMSGLDIRYNFGDGHPLLGRRIPDVALTTAQGLVRVYELLHEGQHLLLGFASPETIDVSPWGGRVRLVNAACDAMWAIPVIGVVEAPTAVLVRPDGHVAWVGSGSHDGLGEALTRWCGNPR